LVEEKGHKYDLVFIDADKPGYIDYFKVHYSNKQLNSKTPCRALFSQ